MATTAERFRSADSAPGYYNGPFLFGVGAPVEAPGQAPCALYADMDAGSLYLYSQGAWAQYSGGGGGGVGEVHFIATPGQDPNSHISGTRGAIAYDGNGEVWVKTNSGTNATGWVQVLN